MKIFLIAMLIVGTVIGAGFASGAEVAVFFTKFGYYSLPMIAAAGALFYFFIVIILKAARRAQEKGAELNKNVFGKVKFLVDFVMIFNSFIILSGMFAGADAAGMGFHSIFRFPIMSLGLFVCCFFVVKNGLKGMMGVNVVLVPLIIVAMLLFGGYGMTLPAEKVENVFSYRIFVNPMLYSGMNMLLAAGTLKSLVTEEKQIKRVAFISSAILTILILITAISIIVTGTKSPTPLVSVAGRMGNAAGIVAGVLVIFAIFTTMITAAFTLSEWMTGFLRSKSISLVTILTAGWCLSRIGFYNIVEYLYPIMGIFGTLYFLVIALRSTGFSNKLFDKRHYKIHKRSKQA